MATREPVQRDSPYCRDCGGTMTDKGGYRWCQNTATTGDALDPKDSCELLGMWRRNYCEQCRLRVNGANACENGHRPSAP